MFVSLSKTNGNNPETFKNRDMETFEYKTVTVSYKDSAARSQLSNNAGTAEREWFVNGVKAHLYKLKGELKLAVYLKEEASKGGQRTILAGFKLPVPAFLTEKEKDVLINKIGLVNERDFTTDDF